MVASVLVAKYADHMPLYRQSQALARQGIVIDRSTLAFWVGYAAAELRPLWSLMRDELLTSTCLFVDETTAPVLDPGRGSTKTGFMWAIARDQRRWGGTDPTAVVFTYAPGRAHAHAIDLLKDFSGVIQCDGYGAYKTLANLRANEVFLSHCWSHVRRDFIDLSKDGLTPIASETLRRIAQFYAIEAEIRGRPPKERQAVRQAQTKPLVEALKIWLGERLEEIPGRLPTAGVIRYVFNHWDGLTRFLDDGHLELDTNSVENAIRPIALNRKNSLFANGDQGGETWATVATLIECCKLQDVEPGAYLTDVLTRLVNGHLQSRLAELTPWAWKTANPSR